jgi:hypothetical protein
VVCRICAIFTGIVGLSLTVVGILGSAPIGPTISPVVSNPTIPFAGGLWMLGVSVIFLSPFIYVAHMGQGQRK